MENGGSETRAAGEAARERAPGVKPAQGAKPAQGVKPVRGFVGPPQRFHLGGWAFDPEQPDAHLGIEIRLDGAPIGEAVANLQFDHLAKAGVGAGDHGFVFNAERELPVAEPHRLQVVALARGGRTPLVFATPRRAEAPPAPPPPRFPHDSQDAAQRPVFIFGSARSGTSALAQALARHTRYLGPGEGHLLDLAPALEAAIDDHYERRRGEWAGGARTLIAATPREFLQEATRHGFVALARTLFPGGHWLDKTPRAEMTLAAPALLRIWPEARFVFMRRRGFENIESRRRKFPQIGFEAHCAGWADSFSAWERVRPALAGRALEIDHFALSREPERAGAALTGLLGLDEAESARLRQGLSVERPERTSSRFAELYAPGDLPWTPAQWETFERLCAPTAARWGYASGPEYFAPGRADEAMTAV